MENNEEKRYLYSRMSLPPKMAEEAKMIAARLDLTGAQFLRRAVQKEINWAKRQLERNERQAER